MEKRKHAGYVYMEINNVNGKKYLGSHCGSKKNYRGSGKLLKLAQKKYGLENFTHQKIIHCEFPQVVEQQMLEVINAAADPNYYNLTNSGTGGMKGFKHTEESKEKIGLAQKGKTNSDETRAKISQAGMGRPVSAATRANMSQAKTGVPDPKTTCPHCQLTGGSSNMTRYHFHNCKHKNIKEK